tara:strand:- start:39 stop:896 length:858 start_codon:yes stop_codon:yes gene_type:complete
MKKILITGSNGFVGKNILIELLSKYKIYVTVRKEFFRQRKRTDKNLLFIIFKNHNDLNIKLKKIKVDYVIHCATNYLKVHKSNDIHDLINTNITFGNIILENLNKMNVKKFINFSTVWQDFDGKENLPFNLYSATKSAFENIIRYYEIKLKNISFYNLYIGDTYGYHDNRKKIINVIKTRINGNKSINITSKNLFLNLLNVFDITNAIKILLKKNIKSGNYNLTNKSFIKISKVLDILRKKYNFKISLKYNSNRIIKFKIFKLKRLPYWKPVKSDATDLIKFLIN